MVTILLSLKSSSEDEDNMLFVDCGHREHGWSSWGGRGVAVVG